MEEILNSEDVTGKHLYVNNNAHNEQCSNQKKWGAASVQMTEVLGSGRKMRADREVGVKPSISGSNSSTDRDVIKMSNSAKV